MWNNADGISVLRRPDRSRPVRLAVTLVHAYTAAIRQGLSITHLGGNQRAAANAIRLL